MLSAVQGYRAIVAGSYRPSSNIGSHGFELEGLHEGVECIFATSG